MAAPLPGVYVVSVPYETDVVSEPQDERFRAVAVDIQSAKDRNPDYMEIIGNSEMDVLDAVKLLSISWQRYFVLFTVSDTFELEEATLSNCNYADQVRTIAVELREAPSRVGIPGP
jgi:hypothetical protein